MTATITDPFVVQDLAAATRDDAKRLAKGREELAKREAAVKALEERAAAARAEVMRLATEGRDTSRAEAALKTANGALAEALEDRKLRAEVVEIIERQALAAVRASRAAPHERRLAEIRRQWDEEVDRLADAAVAGADRLQALAAAERTAAADLAGAYRVGSVDPFGKFVPGVGGRHISMPDATVGLYVVRDKVRQDVVSPTHLRDTLRRREV